MWKRRTRARSDTIPPPEALPEFVREGTYGCVHRPPLRCTARSQGRRDINYANSISKLGEADDLIKEEQEGRFIDRIDPEFKYHLPGNILCDPDINPSNEPAVRKCSIGEDAIKYRGRYKLMIQKNGGYDLDKIAAWMDTMHPGDKSAENRAMNFWQECKTLFDGVEWFLNNQVVHHDIKPGNILYDVNGTNNLRYIDFGMTEPIANATQECEKNKYGYAIVYFYFPFESVFLNKYKFENIKKTMVNSKNRPESAAKIIQEYTRDLGDEEVVDSKGNKKEKEDPNNRWVYHMRHQLQKFQGGMSDADWESFYEERMEEFTAFLVRDLPALSFDDYLLTYFEKLDVYCLGMALRIMLHATAHLLNAGMASRLRHLTDEMMNFNLLERFTIEEAKRGYNVAIRGYKDLETVRVGGTDPHAISKMPKYIPKADSTKYAKEEEYANRDPPRQFPRLPLNPSRTKRDGGGRRRDRKTRRKHA